MYLVVCRSRKRFDRYSRDSKLRDKCVVDARKLAPTVGEGQTYYKLAVFKKLQSAAERNKDIYFIPALDGRGNCDLTKMLSLSRVLDGYAFAVLIFDADFDDRSVLAGAVHDLASHVESLAPNTLMRVQK